MVPCDSVELVRLDTQQNGGNMTAYSNWPRSSALNLGNAAFCGGVFDGRDVWLVPASSQVIVRVTSLCLTSA